MDQALLRFLRGLHQLTGEILDEHGDDAKSEKPKRKPRRIKPADLKSAGKEQESETTGGASTTSNTPVGQTDNIDKLPRVKLVKIAKELGLDTKAKPVGRLRKMIEEARSGGGKKQSKKVALSVLQDTLNEVIEHNYDVLEEAIEELGCGADCYHCPAPEEDSAETQIKACLRSVAEALDITFDEEVTSSL